MKKIIYLLITLCLAGTVKAQDDLLNMIENDKDAKPVPVIATFKATRLITGQSSEHVAKKHLNFVIMHRFGEINKGAYELYGLDQSKIRFTLDYGITDRIQIGLARTSSNKVYDGSLKIKLFKQTRGNHSFPFTINYYGNIAVETTKWANPDIHNYFTSRLSYFNQIVIARKFNDRLSLMIAPSIVHQNLVTFKTDNNMVFALGAGGSIRLNRSVRFNFEYYPRLNGRDMLSASGAKLYDYLGLGFDIETGGHVFQLMVCNGQGMLEQQMIRDTQFKWTDMGIRLGFNIARTFSFDKTATSKKW